MYTSFRRLFAMKFLIALVFPRQYLVFSLPFLRNIDEKIMRIQHGKTLGFLDDPQMLESKSWQK